MIGRIVGGITATTILTISIAAGCGGRSELDVNDVVAGGGNGASGATGGNGGAMGGGGSQPDLPPCTYDIAGEPMVVAQLPERHSIAPSMVVVNAGAPGTLAEIAFQYIASGGNSPLHSENLFSRARLDELWPGVTIDPPFTLGAESHSYGLLAQSRSGQRQALTWWSDLGGLGHVAFRTVDSDTNQLSPQITVDASGQSAVGFAAGAALGPLGVGHDGVGYAIAWRRPSDAPGLRTTELAILTESGEMVSGPHRLTPALEIAPASSVLWTGEHYVIVSNYGDDCPPNEPLCEPNTMVVTRFRPASGDAFDDSGIDIVHTVYPAMQGGQMSRARLAHHAGRSWLAWTEPSSVPDSQERDIRLLELAADGSAVGDAKLVGATPGGSSSPKLLASDQGLVLSWFEPGDDFGPPDQPGASLLRGLALDDNGTVLGEVPPLPITDAQNPPPSLVATSTPRAVYVLWSGTQIGGGLDVSYMARWDCIVRER